MNEDQKEKLRKIGPWILGIGLLMFLAGSAIQISVFVTVASPVSSPPARLMTWLGILNALGSMMIVAGAMMIIAGNFNRSEDSGEEPPL